MNTKIFLSVLPKADEYIVESYEQDNEYLIVTVNDVSVRIEAGLSFLTELAKESNVLVEIAE